MKEHPVDKSEREPICMTDGEFAMRTELEGKGDNRVLRTFLKEGLDKEYEVHFSVRTVANLLLYGKEITREEYDKWVRPF